MSEVEFVTCPICGGRMYKHGDTWPCANCEAIIYEDRADTSIDSNFRAEAAKDLLCAIIQGNESYDSFYVVHHSVEMADSLIKQLRNNEKE